MFFKIDSKDSAARAGTLTLAHSVVQTPVFMPVGTQACVKSIDALDIESILGAQIILANTYHTYLRPGIETLKHFGGVHKFSGFSGSFLSDSGGFQAFSLGQNVKKQDNGIVFSSHIDGSKHLFTPESVLDIQYALNSDIMMVLDDLIALPADSNRLKQSIDTTIKWAKQSISYHNQNKQQGSSLTNNLFGIVQGGVDLTFRKQCAQSLVELEFDGYALGGLAVGEETNAMYDTIAFSAPLLPESKPRYLMGVGTPQNLIEAIDRGIDMFDCVMPTRNARNGTLFTSFGKLNIKNQIHKNDENPIDLQCSCYTCKHFSRGYLHHLCKAREITYFRLATLHNLWYYLELMRNAREAILHQKWNQFKSEFYIKLNKEHT
ncbi:tRNA guanosine(34) transglycosylase Tgt [uncultured Helicobacter sp.]|uniref:tRNA guanosine(34) transglycosylase Tgt n=1 Tax=uncultured Helicobacter sp. TaxID=175537 RepID=UPI00258558FC|nr:tRNA guanosine(34) transglycosylase Tgt [uncultured Helicobacter sp.]